MFSLIFTEKALRRTNEYADNYREYFVEMYTDTGIWSGSMIVDRYIQNSLDRREEIIQAIIHRLTPDIVIGHT